MSIIAKENITETKEAYIVFEEHRRKITFFNQSRNTYQRIHVDGEVITQGQRCDSSNNITYTNGVC